MSSAITPDRIGSNVVGGTSGSLLYINSTGQLAQDNANLFWDPTSHRLGIGASTFGTNSRLQVNPYTTIDNAATVMISPSAATNKGLVLQGAASQSANLLECQNSAGTIGGYLDNQGQFNIPQSYGARAHVSGITNGPNDLYFGYYYNSKFEFSDANTATKGMAIDTINNILIAHGKLSAGGANNGANNVLMVNGTTAADNAATAFIVSVAPANKVLSLQMAAAQTANALEVQSNAGTAGILTRIDAKGRIRPDGQTAHAATDWAQSGFGPGAVISVTGDDQRGVVTVTTAVADTPTANPTLTLTFKDGTWTTAPFAVANYEDTSTGPAPASGVTNTTTATTLVLKYRGTPTATSALTYKFNFIVLG